MKNLTLYLFWVLISIPVMSLSQTNKNVEEILVSADDLPAEVLERIKQKKKLENITDDIETYGKWAGMGKEIGTAVGESLAAVKDVSVDFSNTRLGLITIALVVWKVAGVDLLRIAFATIMLAISWIFITRSYFKSCVPLREYENGKPSLIRRLFYGTGKYTYNSDAVYDDSKITHLVIMAVFAIIAAVVAFA